MMKLPGEGNMRNFYFVMVLVFFVLKNSHIVSGAVPPESVQDVYYCYYATTFDLMQMDADGKDEVFEALKKKLEVCCKLDKNNITYSPKRLATKKGMEKTIRYLLGMDMDRNKRNHLIFILNGFTATNSSFLPVSVSTVRDEFSYPHLMDYISKYLPISSIFFIFNFKNTETEDFQSDSIFTCLKNQLSIPYAAVVCKNRAKESSEVIDGLQLFIDGIEGGADENLDQNLEATELKKYIDIKTAQFTDTTHVETFFSASSDSAFNLALTLIQADSFSLHTYSNKSFTFNPRANPVPHIIVFGTTWCLPCQAEKKDLRLLLRSYPTNKIFYISEDNSDKYAEAKRQAAGYPFIFLLDIGQEIYSRFADHIGYPLTMIIDSSGLIRYKKQGYDEADRLIIQNIIRKLNQK
jgi:thiol-disulfide isomerase/thioredoxin